MSDEGEAEPKHFAATPPDPPPPEAMPPEPAGPVFIPYVTIALVAVNTIVWIVTVAAGAHPLGPTAEWMFAHGGNAGAVTLDGEPWRIGSSMFLHYGLEHVAFNMVGLYGGGRLVERLFGRLGMVTIYFVAGFAGGLASALRAGVVSAGASGAVFGVLGALGAFFLFHRDRMDKEIAKESTGLLVFLGYNLVFGFTKASVDMLAHVGGLGAGFIVAIALDSSARRGVPGLVTPVASFLVIIGAILFAPAPVDEYRKAFQDLTAVEEKVLTRWNQVVELIQQQAVTEEQLADVIERELLPPWRGAIDAFDKSGVSDPQVRSRTLDYLRTRRSGFETMLEGLRASDRAVVERGAALMKDADKMVEAMGKK